MLLESVRAFLLEHGIADSGASVLVAVSGGIDSVVLLDALSRLSTELGLTLAVAHLDHGWRADSAEDARFIADLAADAGLQLVSERLDEADVQEERGLGREGAAREVRRQFLLSASESLGTTYVATGHNADDRAETILFNLSRGTGIAGLSGIDPVQGPFIRPLIGLARDEISAYAEERELRWREDETNADIAFARNRIRHRVLPELKAINPKAVEAICRAGDHAKAEEEVERLLITKLWSDVAVFEEPGEIRLRRETLTELPRAIQTVVLREACRRVRGDLEGVDRSHILFLADRIADCEGHADVPFPRLHARIDGEAISLSRAPFPESLPWEVQLELGRTELPDRGFAIELAVVERSEAAIERGDRNTEVADADRVTPPLTLRNRRAGDRFTPLGMDLPVKLKDFLISDRVPYFGRDDVPLLCDRDRILWVAGVRLSNDVLVTDSTKRLLSMRLEVADS
jgi:tRNA(Ile)-lysidine synthase